MNILITAIGSMASNAAIKSFRKLKSSFLVGSDINPENWLVTSGMVNVFHQTPRADAPNYISSLIALCEKYSINYIVPLTDPEVDILSSCFSIFQKKGVNICISNKSAIDICRDKLKLFKHFEDSTFVKVIPTYTKKEIRKNEIPGPLIAKPKNGRSSEGIFKINNPDIFQISRDDWENYIFQPILPGAIFTVDYVRDKNGTSVSIPREELIRTNHGAGLTVKTIRNDFLSEIVSKIGDNLNITGSINLEFISNEEGFFLMDINPRLSAGVAFSELTGYDVCKNHIKAFTGEGIEDFTGEAKFGIYAKNYMEVKL